MSGPASRAEVLERLHTGTYDVLVIGGGIVGARAALEAARAGMRTALVEGGDIASGTSGVSTKLVHGGLRYLATAQVGLVRRAQHERSLLETHVAPSLVWSLPLVLVTVRGGTSRALLPAAISLYRWLADRDAARPSRISRAEAVRLVPALDGEAATASALVHEGQTNDARLTLALAGAAARAGADVLTYGRVASLEQARGRVAAAVVVDEVDGGLVAVRARGVVNATGPWVDAVRRLERPGAAPTVRLSKGVNVYLRCDRPWAGGLALFDRTRSVVATPWQGLLLVGATDTAFDGEAGSVTAAPEEVESLLGSLAGVVDSGALDSDRVVAATAGLRALALGRRTTTAASRDHVLHVGEGGMVSVAGGKLTTHRLIARDALAALPPEVRLRSQAPDGAPLAEPASPAALRVLRERVGEPGVLHLLRACDGSVDAVAAAIERDPGLLEPIAAGGPDLWAQALVARDGEWALCVDDVLRRRTTVELRGLATPAVRARVGDVLGLPQSVRPAAHAPSEAHRPIR